MKLNDWVTGLLFFVMFLFNKSAWGSFCYSNFPIFPIEIFCRQSIEPCRDCQGGRDQNHQSQRWVTFFAGVSGTFRCWRSSSLIHLHLGSWWGPEIRVSFWCVVYFVFMNTVFSCFFNMCSSLSAMNLHISSSFLKHVSISVIVFYIRMTYQQSTDFDRGKSRLARSTRSDTVSLIRQARICQSKSDSAMKYVKGSQNSEKKRVNRKLGDGFTRRFLSYFALMMLGCHSYTTTPRNPSKDANKESTRNQGKH